jgi:hypothetical protein
LTGLIPLAVVTVTSTVPSDPAGATAVIRVGPITVNDIALVLLNLTEVAPPRLVPVMVTDVPPAVGPLLGLMALTVGDATITDNENVLNDVCATGVVWSVAVTVKVVAASNAVGVPVI